MIYTLFYSRLAEMSDDTAAEYQARQTALLERARENYPGFVDSKSFTAEDGERLTVVTFSDLTSLRQWSSDTQHLAGKRKGREEYYSEYRLVLCEEVRRRSWAKRDDP